MYHLIHNVYHISVAFKLLFTAAIWIMNVLKTTVTYLDTSQIHDYFNYVIVTVAYY